MTHGDSLGIALSVGGRVHGAGVPDADSIAKQRLGVSVLGAGFVRVLAAPLLPVAAAALVVEVVVRGDVATPVLWQVLGVSAQVPDAAIFHGQVLGLLYHGTPLGPAFTVPEARHLVDVAGALTCIRWSGVVAAGLLGLMAVVGAALRSRILLWCLRDGARLGFACATAIAGLGLQWSIAFRAVHPLLFPGATTADDDGWDFPPDALLVRLYPDSYFAGVLALVVVLWLGVLVGAWAAARRGMGPGAPRAWGFSRVHAVVVGLAVLALPVGVVAGYHLWRWQGAAAGVADGVLLGLGVGAMVAWFARRRATAVLGLGIGLAGWMAMGVGVREAGAEAERVAERGNAVVAAIAAFRGAHGRLPAGLDELVPGQLAAVPAVPVGSGRWYYQHVGGRYWLGFQGPLAWMYEYASERGTWNVQEF